MTPTRLGLAAVAFAKLDIVDPYRCRGLSGRVLDDFEGLDSVLTVDGVR